METLIFSIRSLRAIVVPAHIDPPGQTWGGIETQAARTENEILFIRPEDVIDILPLPADMRGRLLPGDGQTGPLPPETRTVIRYVTGEGDVRTACLSTCAVEVMSDILSRTTSNCPKDWRRMQEILLRTRGKDSSAAQEASLILACCDKIRVPRPEARAGRPLGDKPPAPV